MSAVRAKCNDLASQISKNLNSTGKEEKVAGSINSSLSSIEDKLLAAYSKPSPDTQEIGKLTVQLDRAKRAYEGFMKLMDGADERIRLAIQSLTQR